MNDSFMPVYIGSAGTGVSTMSDVTLVNPWLSFTCAVLTIIYLSIAIYQRVKK